MPRALSLTAVLAVVFSATFLSAFVRARRSGPTADARRSHAASGQGAVEPARPPPAPPPPARVETVPIEHDLPGFVLSGEAGVLRGEAGVLRGDGGGSRRPVMLFVPGMCVHPVGYVETFRAVAAARGDLVTLQGDVSCGGDGFARKWSGDLEAMNRRIAAVFASSGLPEPHDVTVIGYSQGAERAERLVARWPDRYSRAILIASPITPSPGALARTRGVVLMSGTLDPVGLTTMRAAVAPLQRAGVRSTFVELPGARHGQMGTDPAAAMAQALDFVGVLSPVVAPDHTPDRAPDLTRDETPEEKK